MKLLRLIISTIFQLIAAVTGFMAYVLLMPGDVSLAEEISHFSTSPVVRFMAICLIFAILALITLPIGSYFPKRKP